ncbi:unnamed protein product [Nezara viridula]|uniref:Kelch domain-containing protein 10 n=1 Tax=Nezara viridula TaxID=85310 RepID=A0A9P0HM75_NEZVI|nr:unnamed protein product [Nezara viridula]
MQSSRMVRSEGDLLPNNLELYAFKPFVHEILRTDSILPHARSGHRVACDDDNLYVYGGYNPNIVDPEAEGAQNGNEGCLFREVLKFNFASMMWKKLNIKDIPYNLASVALIMSGKVLMVYGGTGVPFHSEKSNVLYVCNLGEQEPQFRKITTTGKVPAELYGQAMFFRDNHIYVVGGTTGYDYFLDVHRLNLTTNVWEEVYICKGLKGEPSGRYRHEIAVVGNKVYILGGGRSNEGVKLEEIPVFDLDEKVWEIARSIKDEIHGYPAQRQFHSTARIPGTNSFILIGGVHGSEKIYDDCWRLDISSLSWKKISSLQLCIPVFFHGTGVTSSGRMASFGGVVKKGRSQRRVAIIQSAWICIPKLKDISWEAVVHYGFTQALTSIHFQQLRLPSEYYNKLL